MTNHIRDEERGEPRLSRRTLKVAAFAAAILAFNASPSAWAAEDEAAASTLPEVSVEGKRLPSAISVIDTQYFETAPYSDGGEFLRSLPGVTSVRMSGYGLEPVIRGQQQNRLNILSDGAFLYGACPNRMDPPTSLSTVSSFEEIEVIRGYQTVTRGPGGPGGTVRMVRQTPRFEDGENTLFSLGAGGDSNGSMKRANAKAAVGFSEGFGLIEGSHVDAGNYKDGNNDKVRSAYTQSSALAGLGWSPRSDTDLQLSYERDHTKDVLFAGAGMDSPRSDTATTRLSFEQDNVGPVLRNVSMSVYDSSTEHLMDNYSLRSFGATTMKVDSTSDTFGGRMAVDLDLEGTDVTLGADMQHNTRDATRLRGTTPFNVTTVQAYMWPDLALVQAGTFGEATVPMTDATSVTVGARYDYVNADAGRADQIAQPTGAISRSPNDLYELYYGTRMENETEHNLGGVARYNVDWNRNFSTYAGISRSVRTADATERAMAGDHGTASNRQIGNPSIQPEKHHQVELGATAETGGWRIDGSVYHDWVSDFIFRDRARGQNGILLADNATVYHNIDARLWGAEIAVGGRLSQYWSLTGNVAYTYGENDETGVPLPQIPPLNGLVDLAYENGDWLLGARANFALTQSRVDDETTSGSGLDVRRTPGYVVPDLYASYFGLDPVEIRFGISNLFDRTYSNHLNRSNTFDVDQVQVNEPGRSFYLEMQVDF